MSPNTPSPRSYRRRGGVAPEPADGRPRLRRWSERIWSGKEHYRVAFVAAAAVAVFVGGASLARHRIDTVDTSVETAQSEVIPAQDALVQTARALREQQYLFLELLGEDDPAARVVLVEDVRQVQSMGEVAWAEYKDLAVGFDGEDAMIVEFDRLKEEQDQLIGPVGLVLVQDGPIDLEAVFASPQFQRLRLAQEESRVVVQRLVDEFYAPEVSGHLTDASAELQRGREEVRFALALAGGVGLVVFVLAWRTARIHERGQASLNAQLAYEARRNALEASLQRALTMSPTEDDALEIVTGALTAGAPGQPVELLLADSSETHFQQVLSTDHGLPGCPVVSPLECPASQGTETKVFSSSAALDACPHLRRRAGEACSAVCVPVNIAGASVGVLHTTAPEQRPPSDEVIETIELVGDRLGNRLSLMRAMAERETQARSDPLTGLLNRRSLEAAVKTMVATGARYVVAFGDLDRFKQLNDNHGHEAGDRALRLFARALRDSVRPNDLACRYGGEEFLIVIPEASLAEAADVVERVRTSLESALAPGTTPHFTVSFGLADSTQAHDFDAVVGLADLALLEAKAAGRDRVLIAGDPSDTDAALPDAAGPEG